MKNTRLLTMINIIILTLFIFTLLLSITGNLKLYKESSLENKLSNNTRISSNYIINKARESDGSANSNVYTTIDKFYDQDALYITYNENGIKYYDIIYYYNNGIYEIVCDNIENISPSDGEKIINAYNFEAKLIDNYNMLITYKIDEDSPQQTLVARIRSGKTYER